jgi:hypothetical protein
MLSWKLTLSDAELLACEQRSANPVSDLNIIQPLAT